LLQNRDLLYFSLHGRTRDVHWFGDDDEIALHVDAFQGLDLSRTVVFVANCYLPTSPFLGAILACGPRLLVAGEGQNFTRTGDLIGANLLGYYIRRAVQLGLPPRQAYTLALARLKTKCRTLSRKARAGDAQAREDLAANRDALAFSVYSRYQRHPTARI
jgi:hypothetical protein